MMTFHEWSLNEMAKGIVTSPEVQAQVVQMAKDNLSTADIARRTGLARNTIDNIVRKNLSYQDKIDRTSAQSQMPPPSVIDQILSAHNAGVSDEELAARYHTTLVKIKSIIVNSQPTRNEQKPESAPDYHAWPNWQQNRKSKPRNKINQDVQRTSTIPQEIKDAIVKDYDENKTPFSSLAKKYNIRHRETIVAILSQEKNISREELLQQHPHKRANILDDETRANIIQAGTQEFLNNSEIARKFGITRETVIRILQPFLTPFIIKKRKEKNNSKNI